jgi:subtilase family serine protease
VVHQEQAELQVQVELQELVEHQVQAVLQEHQEHQEQAELQVQVELQVVQVILLIIFGIILQEVLVIKKLEMQLRLMDLSHHHSH